MSEQELTIETLTEQLKKANQDSIFLACLESAGVDNWNGYSYAYDIMEQEYPEEYARRFGDEGL